MHCVGAVRSFYSLSWSKAEPIRKSCGLSKLRNEGVRKRQRRKSERRRKWKAKSSKVKALACEDQV
jgi:hypothetical protein